MNATNTTGESTNDTFQELGLSAKLLHRLEVLKFTIPTPIQKQAIPVVLKGKDVVGIAQTGTGKTLAFGLPLIQRIGATGGRGLIIVPTRELAIQVEESLRHVGSPLGLRTAVLIGGTGMWPQVQALKKNPHIVVATPGRLLDHLEQKNLTLNEVVVLVLDEADRMLDMGFAPQINRIFQVVPKERQTLLFSATMPADIVNLSRKHLKDPMRVEVARAGSAAEQVAQELFVIAKHDKDRLLDRLLCDYSGTVLVFTRTKYGAKKVCQVVQQMGHSAAEIHSNRSLGQRRQALAGFKSGAYRVLVATDIASRGIDVIGISLVINYDLPENAEDYVHRIGRTGRAGRSGKAIAFAMPDQRDKVREIERLVQKHLPSSPLPILPPRRQRMEEAPSRRPEYRGPQSRRPQQQREYRGQRQHSRRQGARVHV